MKKMLLFTLCCLQFNFQYAQGWGQSQQLVASDRAPSNEFGTSVAIDGDYMVIGSPFDALNSVGKGSVYVFRNDGSGNWIEHQKLVHPGNIIISF